MHSLPIDHIGIAVTSIEESITLYTNNFGHTLLHREQLASEGLDIAFLENGASTIELISPLNEKSTVHKFITTRGPGLHHIALRTSDIKSDLTRLISSGLKAIDTSPRPGAWGKQIAFLHPASVGGVLLELCQPSSPK